MRRLIGYGIAGAGLVVLGLLGALSFINWWVEQPMHHDHEVIVEVKPGTSLSRLMGQLAREQMLDHPRLATWWGQRQGYARAIKVGEYAIEAGTSTAGLLRKVVAGNVIKYNVQIIEGTSVAAVLEDLRAESVLLNDLGDLDAANAPAVMNLSVKHLEGYVFPDTYQVQRADSAQGLLYRAHTFMREQLNEVWSQASAQARETLGDPYALLVLASIVEKETALDSDRPQIAQVFHNRLNLGMRLQSDPTVIYGLGDTFDGNLTRTHLRTDTPYNSYTRHGLPPTPIAIPSRASLLATANPSSGDLLYFVATGRGDGSSVFSTTLEAHNQAVRRYQLRQQ